MQDRIRLLIFDMDGTIIDSSAVICGAINYVRSKLGLAPMAQDKLLYAVNEMNIHSPRYFYEVEEFEASHIEWFQEYYTAHYAQDTKLYEGMRELLEDLKVHYKLTLATNAYRISAMQMLEHLKIAQLFDSIVCADDVARSKPHPDMLLKILDHFQCPSERALMIGDSLKDKEAADRAEIDTILVDWGFSNLPDAIKKVEELRKILLA